jgi:flagellar biogenesis protein FliO
MNRRLCLLLLFVVSFAGPTVCADDWTDLTQIPNSATSRESSREHTVREHTVSSNSPAAPDTVAPNTVAGRTRSNNGIPLGPRPGSSSATPLDNSQSRSDLSPGSILAALAFVIVIILGLARLFIRKSPYVMTGIPREAVDVLGRRTLDPRNSVYVVQVGSKILLLGSSAAGMNTLSEITDPIEVATLTSLCRAEQSKRPDVSHWLAGIFRREAKPVSNRNFAERFGGRLAQDPPQQTLPTAIAGSRSEGQRVA